MHRLLNMYMQYTPKSYDQAFYKGSNTKQYLFDFDLICCKLHDLTTACTEIFARFLFSLIAFKDIFVTIKNRN